MEDDSKFGGIVKVGLGAVGLGAVGAAVGLPRPFGIWVAVAILLLCLLFFGGYILWRRARSRRQSRMFSSAIEAQTGAAPKAISDPNQRAALDKLRQKFQTGMQEFKSRGKDIYKLPWYVIIGESGSGKTEAIRHSGVEFPPGLQDELQGSGGTVNMDWWFTNRGIILDTAGSMIFRETQAGEAPEWGEFLRLLKKSRPQCPVNGLFLVLSIESLIKDSADKIAEKASKLAQQLDLIQRTLDVRFPVYLLVTKADLLTGFREFFDNIEDPLLQHQMFGWSNPEPLDSHFRPDLVEQHLKSVADRLRRRRLALLMRETAGVARMGETSFFTASPQSPGGVRVQRRLDEMDSMFALPESVMRLVPRLRRYLETVFVAGEWSAKPVFLRGIYFTSSMREGKALDEAIALATGLSVDQLPEDRTWEKNRAFFLRDLFVEKVFRESGLVTRATNTIQLLRKRQFAIFGTAAVAMLLLIVFAGIGFRNLKRNVLEEAKQWEAGANGWKDGVWSPAVVRRDSGEASHFVYAGTNQEVQVGSGSLSAVEYQQRIQSVVEKKLSVSWIFRPLFWVGIGPGGERKQAQRALFEHGVLKPLVEGTRAKMKQEPDVLSVARHQNALLSLIQLQADAVDNSKTGPGTNAASYLTSFLSYLTDTDLSVADTNLVAIFKWTYSEEGGGYKEWPPQFLRGGDDLTNNRAIKDGLEGLRKANVKSEGTISNRLAALNALTTSFVQYRAAEQKLFTSTKTNLCDEELENLSKARESIASSLNNLQVVAYNLARPLTNLSKCYDDLAAQAAGASGLAIESNLRLFSDGFKASPLCVQINKQLSEFRAKAAGSVQAAKKLHSAELAELDANYIRMAPGGGESSYEARWSLLLAACTAATEGDRIGDNIIGNLGVRFSNLATNAQNVSNGLNTYRGPFAEEISRVCTGMIGQDMKQLQTSFIAGYCRHLKGKLGALKFPLHLDSSGTMDAAELVTVKKGLVRGLEADLNATVWQTFPAGAAQLGALGAGSLTNVVNGLVNKDDSIAQIEIRFSPPNSRWSDVNLRYVKLFVDNAEKEISGGKRPGDLSSITEAATPIATQLPINARLRLEFYSDLGKKNNTATIKFGGSGDNWALVRLIKAGEAEQINNQGTDWKLKFPVTVAGESRQLDVFEIHLNNPLPGKGNWPK